MALPDVEFIKDALKIFIIFIPIVYLLVVSRTIIVQEKRLFLLIFGFSIMLVAGIFDFIDEFTAFEDTFLIGANFPYHETIEDLLGLVGFTLFALGIVVEIEYIKSENVKRRQMIKTLQEQTERLKELDKMKSEFISIVSHEFRTPLSIIKEGISLIIDRIPGQINEKQEKLLTSARSNIDRLSRIINNLLDLSKIEADKIGLQKEAICITEIIEKVVASFSSHFDEKNLKLALNFPNEKLFVFADPDRIVQVFTNLIDNAIKFTNQGQITMSVEEKTEVVECVVADTGVGIPPENMPRVFSKFEQFSRVPVKGQKGSGLGLSIVKGIIELHKGQIRVESEVGEGTTFIFTLPKYVGTTFRNEYINTSITQARKKNVPLSLIVASVADFDKLPPEVLSPNIKEMKNILRTKLRHAEDTIYSHDGDILICLLDCNTESAGHITQRLQAALTEHLKKENFPETITVRFGYATFPDQAQAAEQLLKVAKKS